MKKFTKNIGKITLGSAQFGMSYGITNKLGKVSKKEIQNILRYSKLIGINSIDTAQAYSNSESILGNIGIKKFLISTKLLSFTRKKRLTIEDQINKTIESSLKKLKIEKLDTVFIHDPKELKSKKGDSILNALFKLKSKKLINQIGASLYTIKDLNYLTSEFNLDKIQFPYNVFDQRLKQHRYFEKLKKKKILIETRSIFLQGLLLENRKNTMKNFSSWKKDWNKWDIFLSKNNISPITACLDFVLKEKYINKILVGVQTTNQLKEIVKSLKLLKNLNYEKLASSDIKLINPSIWKK